MKNIIKNYLQELSILWYKDLGLKSKSYVRNLLILRLMKLYDKVSSSFRSKTEKYKKEPFFAYKRSISWHSNK